MTGDVTDDERRRWTGFDDPARELTDSEVTERDRVAPALAALRAYLLAAPVAATLPQGRATHAPVEPARRRRASTTVTMPGATELYLSPQLAYRAIVDRPIPVVLPEGAALGAVTPAALADAVTFMGGAVAVTVRGVGEADRRTPHRNPPGWYRLSAEMVGRVRAGHFVPSLRGLVGGDGGAGTHRASARLAQRRRAALVTPEAVRVLVVDMLRRRPVTVLVGRALAQHRPLAQRARGRQERAGTWTTDRVWVAVSALAEFIRVEGVRHGVPEPGRDGVLAEMLAEVGQTWPGIWEVRSHVRGPDRSNAVRHTRGWLAVHLPTIGLDELDADVLRREFVGYRDNQVKVGFAEAGGALLSARSIADEPAWRTTPQRKG